MIAELTISRVKELVHYDPETGAVSWAQTRRGCRKGATIGSVNQWGYLTVRLDGKACLVHRLAWFYMTGEWPPHTIDHINGVRNDNRWANLRLASWSQNLQNRGPNKNNTSGAKGVWWNKRRHTWQAAITVRRKNFHIGYFGSVEEASAAYEIEAVKHFGEFARAA